MGERQGRVSDVNKDDTFLQSSGVCNAESAMLKYSNPRPNCLKQLPKILETSRISFGFWTGR